MKKFLNIMIASLVLVGCTTFETYEPAPKGDIPTITVEVDPTTIGDSTFTLVITPSAETTYYSFIVQGENDTIEVNGYNLLKGKTYNNARTALAGVLNVSNVPVMISNMRKADNTPLCSPNTTYQIYAVASNSNGVVGDVVQLTVTTTDGNAPSVKSFTANAANKAVTATFSESLMRVTGAVTVSYYKEFDTANPVSHELAAANIVISGNTVTLSAPDAPAGAFVNFNWEAAAFTDIFGNPCIAYTNKGFNTTTGAHQGIRFRAAFVPFDVLTSYFVSPAIGSTFLDWATFSGTITFNQPIFRVNSKVKTGDLTATYVKGNKTSNVQLVSGDWSVSASSIIFQLPEAPEFGSKIDLIIKAGVVFDVWGNSNNAYSSTTPKWTLFEFTKSMVLGNFNFSYKSSYDDPMVVIDGGSFSIEEDTSRPNGITIKDFYLTGSVIQGSYDLDKQELYIPDVTPIGIYVGSTATYGLITYNLLYDAPITFKINADGTIVCADHLGIVATNPLDYTALLGYFDKMVDATFTPAAPAAVKSRVVIPTGKTVVKAAPSRKLKR